MGGGGHITFKNEEAGIWDHVVLQNISLYIDVSLNWGRIGNIVNTIIKVLFFNVTTMDKWRAENLQIFYKAYFLRINVIKYDHIV